MHNIQMTPPARLLPETPVRPKVKPPVIKMRPRTRPAPTTASRTPVAPNLAQAARLSAQAALPNNAVTPAKLPSTTPGDVDGDGKVNKKDLVAMLNYLFSGGEKPERLANADFNADGRYSLGDVLQMVQVMLEDNDDD